MNGTNWMETVGVLAAAGVLVAAAARTFVWISLFRPQRRVEADPAAAGLAFEEVFFFAEDGVRLHGWWIPHPAARGSIVYCHGNAGNIGTRIDVASGLHALGVNVFLFDYRGYGRSRGWAGEQGTYRDACAAYEVVRARHGDAECPPVLAFGASLGGAIAVELARRRPVLGVVLEGAFTSTVDVGRAWYPALPARWIVAHRYETEAGLRSLSVPVLIAHSRDDAVIPYAMGERLLRAAPEPRTFVTLQGEHGEAGWRENPDYARALRAFLDRTLAAQNIPAPPPFSAP